MIQRVLVVEDVEDMRLLLRITLERVGGFEVVGEAKDGIEAVAAAAAHRPDVIVLDLGLPRLAGSELVQQLRDVCDARIVIFTGSDATVTEFAGEVDGFVRKGGDATALVSLLLDLDTNGARTAVLPLEMTVAAPAAARAFVAEHCRAWGCEEILDQALVIVSELVTNAVIHARSHPHLLLSHRDKALRMEVADDSDGSPNLRSPGPDDEHGRGLFLVAAFSEAWGVDRRLHGKRIWAQLPCAGLRASV